MAETEVTVEQLDSFIKSIAMYLRAKIIGGLPMYVTRNFKTKKALKDAVAAGEKIHVFSPGLGIPKLDGTESVEGPHYPEPHRWYAKVTLKDGVIVKVE